MSESIRYLEGTAVALGGLIEAVLYITNMNMQIASATEEQGMVAEDISKNIEIVNAAAVEVTREAESDALASECLTKLSAQQSDLAQQFRC